MLQATSQARRAQQRLTFATLAATRKAWDQIGEDFDAGWQKVGPRLTLLTASAQLGGARNGAAYVPASLAEQRIKVAPDGEVNPRAFAGVASDGRPLDSLLYGAVVRAKTAQVDSLPQRLMVGRSWLDMAVHTQVADAFRGSSQVGIAARPRIGWIRMLNGPTCSRCAILAGRFYRYDAGFQRHPGCDCYGAPTRGDAPEAQVSEPPLDQVTGLSEHERKAIEDGADMPQVVNARRGKSGMTTTEGTTRHGLAGQRLQGRKRLTPDAIYRLSSDREQALSLLKQHGYLL